MQAFIVFLQHHCVILTFLYLLSFLFVVLWNQHDNDKPGFSSFCVSGCNWYHVTHAVCRNLWCTMRESHFSLRSGSWVCLCNHNSRRFYHSNLYNVIRYQVINSLSTTSICNFIVNVLAAPGSWFNIKMSPYSKCIGSTWALIQYKYVTLL